MDSRLEAIIQFIPIGSRVADIGTDHGYLAIELIKREIANFVVASDKNFGPLEAARNNVKNAKIYDKIDLRLGDGLKILKAGEVDVICIAGMGGTLICDILNAVPEIIARADRIILQPMNAIEKVRQWSSNNNFYIEDEDLAEVDDIIYEIICLGRNFTDLKSTRKSNSSLYSKLIEIKIKKMQKILESMSLSQKSKNSNKYFKIENQIKELKVMLSEKSNRTDCLRRDE